MGSLRQPVDGVWWTVPESRMHVAACHPFHARRPVDISGLRIQTRLRPYDHPETDLRILHAPDGH